MSAGGFLVGLGAWLLGPKADQPQPCTAPQIAPEAVSVDAGAVLGLTPFLDAHGHEVLFASDVREKSAAARANQDLIVRTLCDSIIRLQGERDSAERVIQRVRDLVVREALRDETAVASADIVAIVGRKP